MTKKPATILAIESSAAACSVAIGTNAGPLCHLLADQRNQAESLIPLVAEAMHMAACDWQQIDLIAVAVGPGSFTGLRIGVAAARGLALAARRPVIGIGTAAILASQIPQAARCGHAMLIAIDSKRDDLFVQPFDGQGQPLAPMAAMSAVAALALYPGPLLVAGDAAHCFQSLRADVTILRLTPSALALLDLAITAAEQGGGLPAQPLYVRPPDVTLPRAVPG